MDFDFPGAIIKSPCTKVCTIDVRSQLCIGCQRTGDEIMRWRDMSHSERTHYMAIVLPARAAQAQP